MKSIRSREGGLAGGASGEEGMLSHKDAYGSCGFFGVRGGGRRDSEREATRSREGRGRGGVILRRGVCMCVWVVRMGWDAAEDDADVDAYGEEWVEGEDE